MKSKANVALAVVMLSLLALAPVVVACGGKATTTTTRAVTTTTPTTQLEVLWKWKSALGATHWSGYVSPTISDEVAYFGHSDTHVYALDARTGKERWKFKTGDLVNSSPAVSGGVVYVGSDDEYLYALDARTGKERWKFPLNPDNTMRARLMFLPAISDAVVYASGGGAGSIFLYAVDTRTGTEKWRFKTSATFGNVYSSPAVSGGVVYIGGASGGVVSASGTGGGYTYLCALDAQTGQKKWEFRTGKASDTTPSAAVSGGMVYVRGGSGADGYLYALDAQTGTEKWKFAGGLWSVVSDGVAYVIVGGNPILSLDSYLYALDSQSGQEKWRFHSGEAVKDPAVGAGFFGSPVISGGVVYVRGGGYVGGSYLYALDAQTGKEKWKSQAGEGGAGPVVSDGVLYLGWWDASNNGYLYAMKLD